MVYKWGDMEYNSFQGFLFGEHPTVNGKKIVGAAPLLVPGAGAWNTLGTTGKVAVTGVTALGGGYLLGSLFGGKAQTQAQSFAPQNPIQNTYTNTFSNQVTKTNQITGDWSSNIIYSSPGASIKKGNLGGQAGPVSPSLTPQVSIVPSQSASQQGSQGQGTDWATLAAIAGVALVAYGYTSRKGAK